eukprot:12219957-Alexandrium_andersonii.AAC.1
MCIRDSSSARWCVAGLVIGMLVHRLDSPSPRDLMEHERALGTRLDLPCGLVIHEKLRRRLQFRR